MYTVTLVALKVVLIVILSFSAMDIGLAGNVLELVTSSTCGDAGKTSLLGFNL